MEEAITTLAEIGSGPATVTLGDGTERDLDFETVDVEGSGLRAEAIPRGDGERRYRIERPPHVAGPLTLEARSFSGGDWEDVGHVAFVEAGGE